MQEADIEIAKSWFVLAQITIILAGFLFASYGIHFTNAQTSLDKTIDLTIFSIEQSKKLETNLTKDFISLSRDYPSLVSMNLEIGRIYLIFAMILTIFSIIFFFVGQLQLKKIAKSKSPVKLTEYQNRNL